MKLIVGLGNPGNEYDFTRHNCGFMAIDYYAKKNNLEFKKKFNGLYSETIINNEKTIILKPQSYMNASGSVVSKYSKYFEIGNNNILVIYDDKDFEIGTFKIKKSGSDAGHNGIKDIIKSMKTENISRIRIGISKNKNDLKKYVLKKMSKNDLEIINNNLETISNVIDDFTILDIEKIMSKYNKKGKDE